MKAIQLLLVICLLFSIFCRTPRQTLSCAIDNLSDGICDDIYKALLNSKASNYVSLSFDLGRIKTAMTNCY